MRHSPIKGPGTLWGHQCHPMTQPLKTTGLSDVAHAVTVSRGALGALVTPVMTITSPSKHHKALITAVIASDTGGQSTVCPSHMKWDNECLGNHGCFVDG